MFGDARETSASATSPSPDLLADEVTRFLTEYRAEIGIWPNCLVLAAAPLTRTFEELVPGAGGFDQVATCAC